MDRKEASARGGLDCVAHDGAADAAPSVGRGDLQVHQLRQRVEDGTQQRSPYNDSVDVGDDAFFVAKVLLGDTRARPLKAANPHVRESVPGDEERFRVAGKRVSCLNDYLLRLKSDCFV
ncbi:hypothetical protein AMK68_02760 [candidate division KD3-62 bacterium DG_56]|uniref:Uncharacterized protein n=1 Tax=candidate division KD3-62 bacterium DG_56 TaxID=1704032 RepID=A0A0S7XNU1_9BACT|nr:MAG: hypothetical protein AMK68_02760 [candidate division KD3-62 bacterium DG_56]